ncbi:hypothetical protein GMRT_12186 [Giardia muris]|uniref:Uncharacterized protein n=1 Tax=Giardia muris TaxID=5742 RepID=A0A4Z1SPN9_GIAMU|nr:hypothetical protein GMRT_12186 [Giardia muris]|eukprot:TNJ27794.1 hypothetical protein GMRT_12186 [Giardia muris]
MSLKEYLDLLTPEARLAELRAAHRYETDVALAAFVNECREFGANYRDAQSCRLVELITSTLSHGSVGPQTHAALARYAIERCSSLLEAGAVAEHLIVIAKPAFSDSTTLLSTEGPLLRYLGVLARSSPRFVHSRAAAKEAVARLVVECVDRLSECTCTLDLEGMWNYHAALLGHVLTIFENERESTVVYEVCRVVATLRPICLWFYMPIAMMGRREDCTQRLAELDQAAVSFVMTYLPLEYIPTPNCKVTAETLRAWLLAALLCPTHPSDIYQAITDRLIELNTEQEHTPLYELLNLFLSFDLEIHLLLGRILEDNPSHPTLAHEVLSTLLNKQLLDLLMKVSRPYPTLPEILSQCYTKAQAIESSLINQGSPDTKETVLTRYLTNLPSNLSASELITNTLSTIDFGMTPAGCIDDLFYQITSALVYDQYTTTQAQARKVLLYLLSHYDSEISQGVAGFVEDTIRRELHMGSAENIRILKGNCSLATLYCSVPAGRRAFIERLFDAFVTGLQVAEVVEASVFMEVLLSCLQKINAEELLPWDYVRQSNPGRLLASDMDKHFMKFGPRVIEQLVILSQFLLVKDLVLRKLLLRSLQAYSTEMTPTADDLSSFARMLRAFHLCGFASTDELVEMQQRVGEFGLCMSLTPVVGPLRLALEDPIHGERVIQILPIDLAYARTMSEYVDLTSFIGEILDNGEQALAFFDVLSAALLNAQFHSAFCRAFVCARESLFYKYFHRDKLPAPEHLRFLFRLCVRLNWYVYAGTQHYTSVLVQGASATLPEVFDVLPLVPEEHQVSLAYQLVTSSEGRYRQAILLCVLSWNLPGETYTSLYQELLTLTAKQNSGAHPSYSVNASILSSFLQELMRFCGADGVTQFLSAIGDADPLFYDILEALQQLKSPEAQRLVTLSAAVTILLKGLANYEGCHKVLIMRIKTGLIEPEEYATIVEAIIRILEASPTETILMRCSYVLYALGLVRKDKPELEPFRLRISALLGSYLDANQRITRDAIRRARLVWLQLK